MNAADFNRFDTEVLSDPVMDMDDVVVRLQFLITFNPFGVRQILHLSFPLCDAFEQLCFGDDDETARREFKAAFDLSDHDMDVTRQQLPSTLVNVDEMP